MQSQKQRLYLPSLVLLLSLASVVHAAQNDAINGVYRGTVGKEQVVLEMGVEHREQETARGKQNVDVVRGRYFFRRFGGTTEVDGTWLEDGRITNIDCS